MVVPATKMENTGRGANTGIKVMSLAWKMFILGVYEMYRLNWLAGGPKNSWKPGEAWHKDTELSITSY